MRSRREVGPIFMIALRGQQVRRCEDACTARVASRTRRSGGSGLEVEGASQGGRHLPNRSPPLLPVQLVTKPAVRPPLGGPGVCCMLCSPSHLLDIRYTSIYRHISNKNHSFHSGTSSAAVTSHTARERHTPVSALVDGRRTGGGVWYGIIYQHYLVWQAPLGHPVPWVPPLSCTRSTSF